MERQQKQLNKKVILRIIWALVIIILGLSLFRISIFIMEFISSGFRFVDRVKALDELYTRMGRLEVRVGVFRDDIQKAHNLHAKLNDYYYESWDNGLGKWKSFFHVKHFLKGGFRNGFVRFSEPSWFDDPNHSRMGKCHLICWRFIDNKQRNDPAFLNLGDLDFRGAKVSMSIRGNNFKPNGSELIWWQQSDDGIKAVNVIKRAQSANWAYVGFPLTKYLLDGKWHRVEFTLVNDESSWMFTGNNHQQTNCNRFCYLPLNNVLAHANIDFIFALAFVDPKKPPLGSIDFDELKIQYHNREKITKRKGQG